MADESKYGEGFRDLGFDLSKLADKDMHSGFFLVLFLKSGMSEIHWMNINEPEKLATIVESVFAAVIKHDARNLDTLIKFLQNKRDEILEQVGKAEVKKEADLSQPLDKQEDNG